MNPVTAEAFAVPDDSFIDPAVYFSPEIYDLEMRHVFPHSWILVADLDELREPGDYVTDMVGFEPVVVVRGTDGALRAFSNVCRHRGALLVRGRGNCGQSLTCPYHGWSFRTDGRLKGISFRQGFAVPVDPDALALHSVRVEAWERWAFVNVSGDAPPLLDWLETVPDTVRNHGFATAPPAHYLDDVVAANWKILVDNGACDYHYWFVHAHSIGSAVDPGSVAVEMQDVTGTMYTRPTSTAGFAPMASLEGKAAEGSFVLNVFPNLLMLAYPNGSCWLLTWSPLALDRTRVRVWTYTHEKEQDPRGAFELLKQVMREDYVVSESVQIGMQSSFYTPGPRHKLEWRIFGFHRRLAQMLAINGQEAAYGRLAETDV
jgi:phenylpropionate dioxygenase-like ring-hydroxylating dioxygenase large terminal subunit